VISIGFEVKMPNCSADLVDALPYIDTGYDDAAREAVRFKIIGKIN